jgi:hypothetical protein
MKVEISNADLIDKITVLELKMELVNDEACLVNIKNEYDLLCDLEFNTPHKSQLKDVNRGIWDFREMLRLLNHKGLYNQSFVRSAKRIIELNDERNRIKKLINEETASKIINEKGYKTPTPTPSPSYSSLDDPVFFMDKF